MTFTPDRRHVLAGTLATSVLGWTRPALATQSVGPMTLGNAEPFTFDDLKRRAKALAQSAYTPPPQPSDAHPLRDMTFDTFAQAVYKPEMELWHGVPGAQPVRLFPQGRYYAEPVAIYVLEHGKARQVVYSPDFFNMPANHPLRTLKSAGFAGFRLMSRGGESDWLAYLGASYFRARIPMTSTAPRRAALQSIRGIPKNFRASRPFGWSRTTAE